MRSMRDRRVTFVIRENSRISLGNQRVSSVSQVVLRRDLTTPSASSAIWGPILTVPLSRRTHALSATPDHTQTKPAPLSARIVRLETNARRTEPSILSHVHRAHTNRAQEKLVAQIAQLVRLLWEREILAVWIVTMVHSKSFQVCGIATTVRLGHIRTSPEGRGVRIATRAR